MKRLLVVRLSAMGDVIHTLPAVLSLKTHAEITWVVEAPYRELVELVAGVKTVPVRMKQWTRHPGAMRAALAQMRGFDEAIDFQGLIKSAILPWVARARGRAGFDAAAIREKPALLFTNRKVHVDTTRHVIEQNLQLARGAMSDVESAPHPDPLPTAMNLPRGEGTVLVNRVITSSTAIVTDNRQQTTDNTGDWDAFATDVPGFGGDVVLLPGAGKPNKLWPVERFRELASRIGPAALAVWGPGERELADAIGSRVAPPTSLRELAGILRRAAVVVGADTGPLHLAAAMGTRVIGLYGPTDPRRNGPYGQLDRVVDRFASTKSMESISVNEVMESLERVVRA